MPRKKHTPEEIVAKPVSARREGAWTCVNASNCHFPQSYRGLRFIPPRQCGSSTSPSAITQNCEQLRWSPLHPA